MKQLVQWYSHKNQEWPLTTKSVTSAVLLALGDLGCQMAEQQCALHTPFSTANDMERIILTAANGELDLNRTLRMGAWGLFFGGSTGHFFYNAVEHMVPRSWNGPRGIAAKVFIDQALYTPPLTLAFFSFQHFLTLPFETRSLLESVTSSTDKLWPTLKVNWVYWSCVHIATFSIIPVDYRVLFVATKNLLWSAFLSITAYAPRATETSAEVCPPTRENR
jgi:hypothetical protein